MPQVTGIVKVWVDGELRRNKTATVNMGGIEATAQTGHRLYGFSDKFMPGEISWTESHMADTDLIALKAMRDVVVRYETDVGTTYMIDGAQVTETIELGDEGEVSVTMQGNPAIEE